MFENFDKQSDASITGLCALPQKQRSQQFQLHLKNISYLVQICEGIAEINTTQTYFNNTNQFLEAYYKFPISPFACLHRFVATFSGTHLVGVVKQKKQAQKEYDTAIKEGRRAAYGEIREQRKDVMAIRIGNIGPGVEVNIEISYIEELKITMNTFYAFSLQTKIFPKTLDLINSNQNQSVNVAEQFQWNFMLKVRSSRKIVKYNVLSQNLKLNSYNLEGTQFSFVFDEDLKSGRNISFIYTTQSSQLPTFVVGNTDESTTVMASFIPKFCELSLGDTEKAAIQNKALQVNFEKVRGEYIFLLDRSGSMTGNSIIKAKRSLIIFLKSLPIDSFFNVISFGSTYLQLFPTSQRNSNKGMTKAINLIEKMDADMGGTEIQEPLKHIFSGIVLDNYPRHIFLLTDGAVVNTQAVINLVQKNAKFSRVHTIGIGADASRDLIEGCAKSGKGLHIYIEDNQDPAEKIIQLLAQSFSEVITNVNLRFDRKLVKSIAPNPASIPYILKGEVANFYITFHGRLTKQTYIQLSYQDSLNKLTFTSGVTIQPERQNFPFIDKMGHFRVIRQLQDSIIEKGRIQDRLYYVKPAEKEKQIINISINKQILSKYTAYLCVEKQLIDGRFQEVKEKGSVKWYSPYSVQHNPVISSDLIRRDSNLNRSMLRGSRGRGRERGMKNRSRSRSKERAQRLRMRSRSSSIQKNNRDANRNMARKSPIRSSSSQSSSSSQKKFLLKCQKKEIKACLIEMKPPPIKNCSYKFAIDSKTQILNEVMKSIVNEQSIEGYWSSISLLKKIENQPGKIDIPEDEETKNVVITIVILKWIKSNIASREYILIVKKALSWLSKQVSFQGLAQKYKFRPQ